ncbi:MAG: hypothetical protein M1823_005168 [Watsoniomyces obsoletus]|nr:MAG: hypothetical protein M1823_005168 [Watsoniomyces obsoletus]
MADQVASIIIAGAVVWWRALKYIEDRNWWTLRLGLSRGDPYVASLGITILIWVASYQLWWWFHDERLNRWAIPITAFAIAGSSGLVLDAVVPVLTSTGYARLRWKAWTGPSRTGIPPNLVPYLGDGRDWRSLASLSTTTTVTGDPHPVDRFAWLWSLGRAGILTDPTTLLQVRAALDQENGSVWVPRSEVKTGVYQPILPDESVSLLWGEALGFRRRCSRGIISVPRELLSIRAGLDGGHAGRPVCLACGIVARNKGLRPASLICNLERNGSFREFEENSVFYPRPAKTLRSRYQAEFGKMFGQLGPSFVTAVTELALLLADIDDAVIADWLDGLMEHQDLPLNQDAFHLGATHEDLTRLYRGHYATMLVGLSGHRIGNRVRPEMLVYDAVCRRQGDEHTRGASSSWAISPSMTDRREEERRVFGEAGIRLIQAII